MSKQTDFIAMVARGAQEVQIDCGMFASITIAQAAWETGWGNSHPVDVDTGEESYNLFGIKAADGEPSVKCKTWEEYGSLPANYISYTQLPNGRYKVYIYDYFRKFDSFEDCILFRAQWLKRSKYWTKAINADTPEQAIHYLQHTGHFNGSTEIGYATDSTYEKNIMSIVNQYDLKQYDFTKEEVQMIKELQNQVATLQNQMATVLATLDADATLIWALKAKVDKPAADEQQVAEWAAAGHEFVVQNGISDGTRPQDFLTRQEQWTMLNNLNTFQKKNG